MRRDVRLAAQPAAAHSVDKRRRQIIAQVLFVHAAGGDEPDAAEGTGQGLHGVQAAIDVGREELDHLQAVGHGGHDLRGGHAAGGHGHIVPHAPVHDLLAEAGGHDEARAHLHRLFALLQGDHRTGAHQHIRALTGHGGDGIRRGVGAEGDLHNVHAAGQQGLRRGDRVIRVFKDHNGNHRRVPEPFQTVHKGSLAFPNINSIA